jgi:hypothetical protein
MADCSGHVYHSGHWGSSVCENKVNVERDGKPYCGTHDPVKVAARRAKKDEKYRAERETKDEIFEAAKAVCSALGAGCPVWGRDGIERAIKLTFEEVRLLSERLRAAESK